MSKDTLETVAVTTTVGREQRLHAARSGTRTLLVAIIVGVATGAATWAFLKTAHAGIGLLWHERPSAVAGMPTWAVSVGVVAATAAPLSVTVFLTLIAEPSLTSIIAVAAVSAYIIRQVISPPGSVGTTLLLARASKPEQEPFVGNQAGGRVFLFLNTDDFWRDYHSMVAKGIRFVREPKEADYGMVAVFADLYGNQWDLLQLKEDHPVARRMRCLPPDKAV